jgi:hypothetical protein
MALIQINKTALIKLCILWTCNNCIPVPSVADPGSGAFSTPTPRIRNGKKLGSRSRMKNLD